MGYRKIQTAKKILCNIQEDKLIKNKIETLNFIIDAIKEEKIRIIEELYKFQKSVSQFSTSKEAVAYNLGLREFAEKLQNEIDRGI